MANKPVFIPGSSLAMHEDGTFSEVTRIFVDDATGATETEAKLNAMTKAGVAPGMPHANAELLAAGVEALAVEVELLADSKAVVTVRWGVPVDPPLDGRWIVESHGESVRELRGLDVNGDFVENKYLPPNSGAEAAFWAIPDNVWQFWPGVQTGAFDNIVHLYLRRHISYSAAAEFPFPPLISWPVYYVNWVNDTIVRMGLDDVPAGVWLCRAIRLTTRNNGWSWLVGAEFIYREWGWEDFNLFVHPTHRQVPNDLTIPDAMKTPWPTDRGPTGPTYGAVRPQMLKGTRDFSRPPFGLMLDGYVP